MEILDDDIIKYYNEERSVMKTKIIREIIDNNNKTFKIGDDVHFILNRNSKSYSCFGIINDIKEDGFVIRNVEIDKMHVSDLLFIKYCEVKDGTLSITYNGYC